MRSRCFLALYQNLEDLFIGPVTYRHHASSDIHFILPLCTVHTIHRSGDICLAPFCILLSSCFIPCFLYHKRPTPVMFCPVPRFLLCFACSCRFQVRVLYVQLTLPWDHPQCDSGPSFSTSCIVSGSFECHLSSLAVKLSTRPHIPFGFVFLSSHSPVLDGLWVHI